MQAERTRVDELPVLEAAGGASDGGTWARVVDGVLEEKDCASLIASVNTKGTSSMPSSRVEWRTVLTAVARERCSMMESMVEPAYPFGAATLLHIAGLANPWYNAIIITNLTQTFRNHHTTRLLFRLVKKWYCLGLHRIYACTVERGGWDAAAPPERTRRTPCYRRQPRIYNLAVRFVRCCDGLRHALTRSTTALSLVSGSVQHARTHARTNMHTHTCTHTHPPSRLVAPLLLPPSP